MKPRKLSAWCFTLASSLVFGGGLGFAAQVPESPASSPPSGSATNGLSLEEAIRLALGNNLELRASGARVEAAAGRAHQARQWTNPELEVRAEDWPVSNGRGFSDAKQTIGIAQTLPYPGKKSLDKQIGGAGVKLSAAELALRRTEIVRNVKAGFSRALASEQLVKVSTQLVAVAASSASAASKRVEAGAAAMQEQLRAELQLEHARTELRECQRSLAAARQILASVLGQPELAGVALVGTLPEAPSPALMEAAPEAVFAQHPSTLAAQASLDRAQLEHRRAKLDPYPDVKVGLAGGRMGDTGESILELGFSLPLPIIDRGKGRQRETQAKVTEAEAECQVVRQLLHQEWANAQKRYRTAAEQVTTYRERILPKAAEALQLVQTGFAEGKLYFIDLVDTQRTTAEAQLAYQQKLLDMSLAQAELEALLQPQTFQFSTKQ